MEKELPPFPAIICTRKDIFPRNVYRPFARRPLPEIGTRINDTKQLAYCLSLLHKSTVLPAPGFGSLQYGPHNYLYSSWLSSMERNPAERQHIYWLAIRMVEEFVKGDLIKSAEDIREIVHLAPMLDQESFRKLLNSFVAESESATLLDKDLLQGVVQLVQCAQPGYLCSDDLIKILQYLRVHLQGTHRQASDHIYRLTWALSRVLDVMAKQEVKSLNRVQERELLSTILRGLSGSSDPFLMYQASYAIQALQYVSDDETSLPAVNRHAGGFAQGIIQVGAVVNLDANGFLDGLEQLRKTLADTAVIALKAYKVVRTLIQEGQGALDALRYGLNYGHKRAWYPAVIVANAMVQEGRLADFRELVDRVDCRQDPAFQWAICQLLGEVALNPIWDMDTREQAVEFLVELHRADAEWGRDANVKAWSLTVLRYISLNADPIVKHHTVTLLEDTDFGETDELHRRYPFMSHLPEPSSSALLARAQNIPSVEYELGRLRSQRLNEDPQPVYIPPQARATLNESDDSTFPLMDKVKEFLLSDRQVFLVLGDSGAGKSIFNRHLERDLWSTYQPGGAIPLFINLPTINKPDQELISKQLRIHNFSQEIIQELKLHRNFILICDGYDESRLRINLHSTNSLNQPGQWDVKMIVTCRSTHVGQDYHSRFQPMYKDRYDLAATAAANTLFQEAAIVPFSTNQIRSYVEQHVQDPEIQKLFRASPVWSVDEYMDKLTQIPNLLELATNPFLLTMALRALPIVVKDELDLSTIKITRLQLFDTFINQWLEINRLRLDSTQLSTEARTALEELDEEGFIKVAIDFSTKLARSMFENQQGNPIVQYSHMRDKATWKARFFGPDMDVTLLRESNPLTRSGFSYRFIHRSLLEYFYARLVSEHEVTYERQKRHISYAVKPSAELLRHAEEAERRRPKELVDHPLLHFNMDYEPEVLQFLSEYAQEDPEYSQRLQGMIDYAVANTSQFNSAVRSAQQILGQPAVSLMEMISSQCQMY